MTWSTCSQIYSKQMLQPLLCPCALSSAIPLGLLATSTPHAYLDRDLKTFIGAKSLHVHSASKYLQQSISPKDDVLDRPLSELISNVRPEEPQLPHSAAVFCHSLQAGNHFLS